MTVITYNVLFLCTTNSARSILAESILQKEGDGLFKTFSAGTQPKGEINSTCLDVLKKFDFNSEGYSSKNWDIFEKNDAPEMDFIITVCDDVAKEICPVWPGHPVSSHWNIKDPTLITGSDNEKTDAFIKSFHEIRGKILQFVNMPLAKLDTLSIHHKLTQIGDVDHSDDSKSKI
jgi:arsenate reductase